MNLFKFQSSSFLEKEKFTAREKFSTGQFREEKKKEKENLTKRKAGRIDKFNGAAPRKILFNPFCARLKKALKNGLKIEVKLDCVDFSSL